ncbi:MAG: hypothetical protein JW873_01790 [Candidatus Saganbacteria bacterium]|nr:hypothetical protein [Candidatus Saganbacteria bacterium]
MKKQIAFLTAVLLLALPALADTYPIRSFHDGEVIRLKASDKASGAPLWRSTVRTAKTTFGGKPFLYIIEEGEGKYGSDGKTKSWRSESYSLIEGGKVIPYQVKQVFKNPAGQVISSLQKDYDRAGRKVICQVNGQQKSYEFQADLIDREILGLYVRNFPFGGRREVSFHLLTNEPSQYKISLKELGRETITVAGQAYDCDKLQLLLDLGMVNLFSVFFPKTYFWVNTAEPHEVTRYEGLESALGTPYLVLEIDKAGK